MDYTHVPELFKAYVDAQLLPVKERLTVFETIHAESSGPQLALELCMAFTAAQRPTSEYGFHHQSKCPCTQSEASRLLQIIQPAGGSVQGIMCDLEALKEDRDSGAHFFTPESIILAVKLFNERLMLPALLRLSMHFVHDVLSGVQLISDEVLGPARVLQLAALSLRMAKAQCYHGAADWQWTDWFQDQEVEHFIKQLLRDMPSLSVDAQAFAVEADAIEARACATGPRMPSLNPSAIADLSGRTINAGQLQASVQLCCQAGLLNEAVRKKERTAALVLDVLPGLLI